MARTWLARLYSAADIGVPKPDALARRFAGNRPIGKWWIATPFRSERSTLPQTLAGVSLVVAATDDMTEQALLAHHAYAAGVSLVACALYKAAAAGEGGT